MIINVENVKKVIFSEEKNVLKNVKVIIKIKVIVLKFKK